MKRLLSALVLAAGLLPALPPSRVQAAPREPQLMFFTHADKIRVQREALAAPAPAEPSWEHPDHEIGLFEQRRGGPQILLNDDNDGTHYARGHTLVIFFFIDHTGGSWDSAERSTAAAKASDAKDWYATNAPYGANVYFDNQGTNGYWAYNVSVPYNIPDDGMTAAIAEDAMADAGFSDDDGDATITDEVTVYLQNWNGGWDNVLCIFTPADRTGRARASYSVARCYLYTDDASSVFQHEWGHIFGACDEYVEDGSCNSGIDCGACQSTYLPAVINNGNCDLVACPSDVSCMMRNNVKAYCSYTEDHWAWDDTDNDGLLDTMKRRVSGGTFTNIWELFHNGYFYWNVTTQGMSLSQHWDSWMVCGLRSPATADYDLTLYGDNNHNYQLASSSYGGSNIDFVVGDYNHSRKGNEHITVTRFSGAADNYDLTFESGTGVLYPDGVVRAGTWNDYNVVRAWDVPLFGGETITFTLDITSGSIDLGMGLYKSNGTTYFAGRSAAVASDDAGGVGATESFTYTVPSDDVYGLVVWGNTAVDGAFSIQIGPTPVTLAEEVPFNSALALRLYDYDPADAYWAFVGSRPEAATDVDLGLYNDSAYQTQLENSGNYGVGSMEWIAVDYNHLSLSPDYLRVPRTAGVGTHRTMWEQSPDLLVGATTGTSWTSPNLAKMWDANMVGGTTYYCREYDLSATFDAGLYLYRSSGGDYYKPRSAYETFSNNAAGSTGEWWTYAAPATDYYGVLLPVFDESSASYSLWFGPKATLADDAKVTYGDEVVWGSTTIGSSYWTTFGIRPSPGDGASVWLYGDANYTGSSIAVSDVGSVSDVAFVVSDYNHTPLGTVYPRFRRHIGVLATDIEVEGGSELLTYPNGGHNAYDLVWPAGDVVEAYDIFIPAGEPLGVMVEDLSGVMDMGIEIFSSDGATYYDSKGSGAARSDAAGVGASESFAYLTPDADYYGLVIWNKNDLGGSYRLHIWDSGVVSAGDRKPLALALRPVRNPFLDQARLYVSLAEEGEVELALFDVQGRKLRTLLKGMHPAGEQTVVWDGHDDAGHSLAAGVYLARLTMGVEERLVKLVRSR